MNFPPAMETISRADLAAYLDNDGYFTAANALRDGVDPITATGYLSEKPAVDDEDGAWVASVPSMLLAGTLVVTD